MVARAPVTPQHSTQLHTAHARAVSRAPTTLQASWVAIVDAIEFKLAKDDLRNAIAKNLSDAHHRVVSDAIAASRQACAKR